MTELMNDSAQGSQVADTDVVRRVQALIPLIREHAGHGAEARQVHPAVIDALGEAGVFRLFIPERLGGLQASMRTILEALAEVSRGDGSTGWVATLIASGTGFVSTFSDQAQEDVFGTNPAVRVSGTFQPSFDTRRVDGGYMVSGRWPYSSGSFAADWATLGIMTEPDDPAANPVGLALFPQGTYTIEPTWYVTGLKGTGSDTIVVENQFVPDHRIQLIQNMFDGKFLSTHAEDPLVSAPFSSIASVILAAPQVGLARHALEITLEKLPSKRVAQTFFPEARASSTHQLGVAKAASKLHLAELLLDSIASDIDLATAEERRLDLETRARHRHETGVIADLAKEAIDLLMTANGSSSFAESNVLSRIWRDSEIAGRHALVTSDIGAEAHGRALLGFPEQAIVL